jgi:hypothetical protein
MRRMTPSGYEWPVDDQDSVWQFGPLWAGTTALTAETLLCTRARGVGSRAAAPEPQLCFLRGPGLFLCARRGFRLASACS